MKKSLAILLLLSCHNSFSATPGQLPNRSFEMPTQEKQVATRDIKALLLEASALNRIIGGYPPRYRTEEEREQTYATWSDLLADANALGDSTEELRLVHALLYRQGHNMDVKLASQKAHDAIQACITQYPASERCHLEATYFYLSLSPTKTSLASAKASLDALAKMHVEKPSEEVEAGYVMLHFNSQDKEAAVAQLQKYLQLFPNAPRSEQFRKMLAALKSDEAPIRKIEK